MWLGAGLDRKRFNHLTSSVVELVGCGEHRLIKQVRKGSDMTRSAATPARARMTNAPPTRRIEHGWRQGGRAG